MRVMDGVRWGWRVFLAPVVIATACAPSAASELAGGGAAGDLIGSAVEIPVPPPVADPVTPPPTTSTIPPSPAPTVAPDPHETVVATAKPEISILDTFAEPDGEPVWFEFAITNPTYFDNDLVLMVTDESADGRWLRVQLPVRPNGSEAWIRAADVTLTTHRFHAQINLTERSVAVWNGDELVTETGAVIGAERSPTPVGSFYINEMLAKWDGSAYGPYILSLSGFSEALETFNGGIPVIAIHGTSRPDLIGGAYSNGCIRIPNEVVSVLAETVPMGTPVEIVA